MRTTLVTPMNEPIDSRQLQIFHRLAAEGSLKKAAESLFLTTSAISHSISNLEDSLGVKLFHRSGRGLVLTNRGEMLYQRGGGVLAQLCALRQQVAEESLSDPVTVRVAGAHSYVSYLLPEVAREFGGCFRRGSLSIRAAEREESLRRLREREADVAIVVDPPEDDAEIQSTGLFADEMCVVVSRRSALAEMDRIPWRALADRNLIVARLHSHTSRMLVEDAQRRGLRFRELTEAGSTTAVLELLKLGEGFALLPAWLIERAGNPAVVTRPIEGFRFVRNWAYVESRSTAGGLAHRTFRRLCQSAGDLVACGTVREVPAAVAAGV